MSETEYEAAKRRGRLYEALAALAEEHGIEDVRWMLGVLEDDVTSAVEVMDTIRSGEGGS